MIDSVVTFSSLYEPVVDALIAMTENRKDTDYAPARGYLDQIRDIEFTFRLAAYQALLMIPQQFSLILQMEKIDFGDVIQSNKSVIKLLADERTDARFEEYLQEAADMLNWADIELELQELNQNKRTECDLKQTLKDDYFAMIDLLTE